MPETTRRTTIEIDGDHTPIQGRVVPDEGTVAPFVGWLQLIQRLDRALGAHAGARAPSSSPANPEPPERA